MNIRQKLGYMFVEYLEAGAFDRMCNYTEKFNDKEVSETKSAKIKKRANRIVTLGMGDDCWSLAGFATYHSEAEAERRNKPKMEDWYFTLQFVYNLLTYRTRRWLNKPFFLFRLTEN